MAITLRLRRMGNRNTPFYRVVAADARTATDGKFVETLGWYDPKQDGVNFRLKVERVEYWAQNGAKLSPTVKSLLKKARKLPAEPEPAPEPSAALPAETQPDAPAPDTPAAEA